MSNNNMSSCKRGAEGEVAPESKKVCNVAPQPPVAAIGDAVATANEPMTMEDLPEEYRAVDEYESTIKFRIDASIYDTLRLKGGVRSTIIHFTNGMRQVDDQFQHKKVMSKIRMLKFHENQWVPMTRKRAQEINIAPPTSASALNVRVAIMRYVLVKIVNPNTNINYRVAVECQTDSNNAATYYITSEVEYPRRYWANHSQLITLEDKLLKLLPKELPRCVFDKIDLTSMSKLKSRRFTMMHTQQLNREVSYVHKFDGHKGRIVSPAESKMLFYDDLHHFAEFENALLNDYPNIAFQVEVLPSKKARGILNRASKNANLTLESSSENGVLENGSEDGKTESDLNITPSKSLRFGEFGLVEQPDREIEFQDLNGPDLTTFVITDVLGGYINGKMFMPEPYDALKFIMAKFNYVEDAIAHDDWAHRSQLTKVYVDETMGRVVILPQHFVDIDAVTTYPTDGMIIVTNNRLFKFKPPTLDVKLHDGYIYLHEEDKPLSSVKFDKPNGIYEVKMEAGDYILLRERMDRPCASSVEDYNNFLAEVTYLKSVHAQLPEILDDDSVDPEIKPPGNELEPSNITIPQEVMVKAGLGDGNAKQGSAATVVMEPIGQTLSTGSTLTAPDPEPIINSTTSDRSECSELLSEDNLLPSDAEDNPAEPN